EGDRGDPARMAGEGPGFGRGRHVPDKDLAAVGAGEEESPLGGKAAGAETLVQLAEAADGLAAGDIRQEDLAPPGHSDAATVGGKKQESDRPGGAGFRHVS